MADDVIVTTCDIHREYQILGPVSFVVSTETRAGDVPSQFSKLFRQYRDEIDAMNGLFGIYFSPDFLDETFYIAVQELKRHAKLLGADAIIGMRQEIQYVQKPGIIPYFVLQMYGTAVKFV